MNKSPAFQFYPADWLGSQRVQMLTLEEEGAYIRLLSYCWQHGSIPADSELLARLLGKGGSTTVARVVATMFQPDQDDASRLVHDRLDDERRKQDAWREKSSKGGLNSSKSRKLGNSAKGGSRVVGKCLQPNGNTTSSSSSSSSSSSYSSPLGEESKNNIADSAEAIYKLYPRKVGKPQAIKALLSALATTPAEKIIACLEGWKNHWETSGTEMQFVPYPATWINRRHWEEDEEESAPEPTPPQPEPEECVYVAPPVPNRERYMRILRGEPDPDAGKIVYIDQPID